MEAESFSCLRCSVAMEQGLLIDATDGGGVQAGQWAPGITAQKRSFLGIKYQEIPKAHRHNAITIVAYRCPSCGMLELHAPGS